MSERKLTPERKALLDKIRELREDIGKVEPIEFENVPAGTTAGLEKENAELRARIAELESEVKGER